MDKKEIEKLENQPEEKRPLEEEAAELVSGGANPFANKPRVEVYTYDEEVKDRV